MESIVCRAHDQHWDMMVIITVLLRLLEQWSSNQSFSRDPRHNISIHRRILVVKIRWRWRWRWNNSGLWLKQSGSLENITISTKDDRRPMSTCQHCMYRVNYVKWMAIGRGWKDNNAERVKMNHCSIVKMIRKSLQKERFLCWPYLINLLWFSHGLWMSQHCAERL